VMLATESWQMVFCETSRKAPTRLRRVGVFLFVSQETISLVAIITQVPMTKKQKFQTIYYQGYKRSFQETSHFFSVMAVLTEYVR